MCRAVIFGGTTEGRKLLELCANHAISAVYCVATGDGARPVKDLPDVRVFAGRLDAKQMTDLLLQNSPVLTVDATHPYAEQAGKNIEAASRNARVPLLRVARETSPERGCICFAGMEPLIDWLTQTPGNVFVTTGSSQAEAFSWLPDYRRRVWLRILPSMESLSACLDLGYPPDRLILMQGPFSQEMNDAMFRFADAKILVTKNAGPEGGFIEKVRAARALGMLVAVLKRPEKAGGVSGVSFEEARRRIMELKG